MTKITLTSLAKALQFIAERMKEQKLIKKDDDLTDRPIMTEVLHAKGQFSPDCCFFYLRVEYKEKHINHGFFDMEGEYIEIITAHQ